MIIQIGTEVDESRILWKYKESDEWTRADIDDLIEAYESRQKEPKPGDLISRQAAIEALGEEPDIAHDTDEEWAEHDTWVIHVRAIESLPPVESERPKGEWVKAPGVAPPEFAGRYVCSNCGHYALLGMPYGSRQELSPFCPNCRAKMER